MRNLARLFLVTTALLSPGSAFAFPEMVRHHYVNCNACHVNPNGGGLLSEYGRGMSGEVLSTWHYENESLFLHGLVKQEKMPSFLNVGGDLRALQLHHETKAVREGRYILMQSRLEAAATVGPVTADIGYFAPDAMNHIHGELAHYYVLGSFTETLQLKAGRFLPAFGINDPHHTLSTRAALGFGYGSERDGVEAHYSGEQWHAALGWSKSRTESLVREKERALNAQIEKFFADSYRVGLSLWTGDSDLRRRWLVSLHGILGFTEHFYLSDETAWQNAQAKTNGLLLGPTVTGVYHFDRLGYEVLQGLHVTGISDISQSDVTAPNALTVLLGGGPVWYPRPHFEIEAIFSQRKILKTSMDWEDYAWIMLHYYL
jgi:hypothetical protein